MSMIGNTSARLGALSLRRQMAAAQSALTQTRRQVSSRPTIGGLTSTVCEVAGLTARAAVTPRRAVPGATRPTLPLWTLLCRNPNTAKRAGAATGTATATSTALHPTAARSSFLSGVRLTHTATATMVSSTATTSAVAAATTAAAVTALHTARRHHHRLAGAGCCGALGRPTRALLSPKQQNPKAADAWRGRDQLQGVSAVDRYREEQEEERNEQEQENEDPFNKSSGPGYLPFPPPFHTINVIMVLFIANVLCYLIMNFGNDDWRDFMVEHFTLSHENLGRIYPIFTNAFYQENLLQLVIDCWLLWQFGDTMLAFLGNVRLTFFAILCTFGGSLIHVARQQFELYYGMDDLEVRGRCYGPNPMIMGLISMEGLIFRHLNFIQQPPIPFLVLTAFVMVIDVWRIFTTRPEEHGAATGGALMAYLFWALPTRLLGLDKLTATM